MRVLLPVPPPRALTGPCVLLEPCYAALTVPHAFCLYPTRRAAVGAMRPVVSSQGLPSSAAPIPKPLPSRQARTSELPTRVLAGGRTLAGVILSHPALA